MLHTIKRRKSNWISHVARRNCLLEQLLKKRWKEREEEEEDVSRATGRPYGKQNIMKF